LKLVALTTGAMAPLMAVGAAYYLGKGSAPVPWPLQSYGGESEPEQNYYRAARRLSAIGWTLTAATTVLSIASAVTGYFS